MKRNLRRTLSNLIQINKYGIVKLSVFVLVTAAGCFLSYTAGRNAYRRVTVPTQTEAVTEPTDSQVSETLNGEPTFEFPPNAPYSDATPSNAELMSPEVLNLAYIYEEDIDSTLASDSFAGQLYSHLTELDARWSSGIYELYNYTPQRLAAQLGLPVQAVTTSSGIIPEFDNVNVQFVNGDGQSASGLSNASHIIAMANTLHYTAFYTIWSS